MPTSPIILTTLKKFTTQKSFKCSFFCSKMDFMHCLKLPQCSMFGINDAWLFAINYLPQRCHKLSKARHNNYTAAFQKLSKEWNWNSPRLQQLRFCVSNVPALRVELFHYIVDEVGESAGAWLGRSKKGNTLPQLSLSSFRGRQNEYQEFLGTEW